MAPENQGPDNDRRNWSGEVSWNATTTTFILDPE